MKEPKETYLEIYRRQVEIHGGVNSDKEERKVNRQVAFVIDAMIGVLQGLRLIHGWNEEFSAQSEVEKQIAYWQSVKKHIEQE